jgi:hypothetical protein
LRRIPHASIGNGVCRLADARELPEDASALITPARIRWLVELFYAECILDIHIFIFQSAKIDFGQRRPVVQCECERRSVPGCLSHGEAAWQRARFDLNSTKGH